MSNNEKRPQKVVVIGAGLGGLSAAISLAAEGFEVSLFDKNDKIGGKLNVMEKQGFSFDLGPSILTMPYIFRNLFEQADRKLEDYVDIQTVEPHWRNFFEDGTVFDLSSDPDCMQNELRKLDDRSVTEFEQFMAYAKKLGQTSEQGYFAEGLDSLSELLKHYGMFSSLLDFDVFRSMDQGVRRFISNPKLIEVLNYFIKYVGSSPYDAPALLNLLPYIQFEYGLWYVKGGMYNLAIGMGKLAEELGVKINLDSEITRIDYKDNKASAIQLKNGQTVTADIIVSNMEVIPAGRKLLKQNEEQLKGLQRFAPSCSGLVMHLGIDRLYDQLAHHNFFYSEHPKQHFNAIFHQNRLSEDPTLYLVAPVKTDPAQAPDGCEIIKVLPHIPHIDRNKPLQHQDYMAFRETVLIKLERMGLTNLRKHIICEETWTPLDIQANYYSTQGSIYGTVSDRFKNLGFKAPQRDRNIANLYYVGGSVNPGGGMPMVTLSGQLVRKKILAEIEQ